MAAQTIAQEINSFSKGIITEASPLTFPDNASINENNLVIENDGSRSRRYGMNYEPGYAIQTTTQGLVADTAFSSFVWKAPGGYADIEFVIVQVGSSLKIFDSSQRPVSSHLVQELTLDISYNQALSYAATDGILIIATGSAEILTLDWVDGAVVRKTGRLKIRDLFGVADTVGSDNLLEGTGIAIRPKKLSLNHIYNLRNQTFATPRYYGGDEVLVDPINKFFLEYGVYQANSDNMMVYLYANPNDSDDRETKRYFGKDNYMNPLGTTRAPMGYFIIDALDRGKSRLEEIDRLHKQHTQLTNKVTTLKQDRTPDGATVVASFSGRIWYSGFSSKVEDGDDLSPRMGSYILFSKLIKSTSDAFKCYQDGDPTSFEAPDILDTDGGFIRIDGAYNIQKMINVGDSLMVLAENGVWRITGGSGYGFKATDYLTSKVTEHGSISPDSAILVDNTIMFWSEDGIYHVAPNQYGDWVASNMTSNTIQKLFDTIPYTSKVKAKGSFDTYQRKARWLYGADLGEDSEAVELILDVNLGAFYTSSVGTIEGNQFPKPVSIIKVPPFIIGNEDFTVIDNTFNQVVAANGDLVVVNNKVQTSSVSETLYITLTPTTDGMLKYTFSYYYDTDFVDWVSHDNVGVDADAFLITGWSGFGDFQRMKQVPALTVYALKTETGFDADYEPINTSSIKVQSQWSWTNSAESGKWGTPFQAYRHRRVWIPDDNLDPYDDGNYVVKTRNKLRGRGSVVSLKFTTEPGKDFKLLGWSYIVNVNGAP